MSEKLKKKKWYYDSTGPHSSWVTDRNMQNDVLINNALSTKMLLQLLSFSDNLFQNTYIMFQNNVDNFEIALKNILHFGFGCRSPLIKLLSVQKQQNNVKDWKWLV